MSKPAAKKATASTGVSKHQSISTGVSKHQLTSPTGVSQHQLCSPTGVSEQQPSSATKEPASSRPASAIDIVDLTGDDDFLKDDIVLDWLLVDWQTQIERAPNTRVEVKKRVELLARSIAVGGWKPIDRFLCFLPASEQSSDVMEVLICLAGHHVSKKYDARHGIDRSEDLQRFDPALVERVSHEALKLCCGNCNEITIYNIFLQAKAVKFREGDGHHKLDALWELLENRAKYEVYISKYEADKGRKWRLPKFVQVISFKHASSNGGDVSLFLS
jgi:hypothetical protein